MDPQDARDSARGSLAASAAAPAARPKRYITKAAIESNMPTPECPAWAGRANPHSDVIRKSVGGIFAAGDAGAATTGDAGAAHAAAPAAGPGGAEADGELPVAVDDLVVEGRQAEGPSGGPAASRRADERR